MNGYFALYEVDTAPVRTFGGTKPGEQIGTVHAAEPATIGDEPGAETLCGRDTLPLRRMPLDTPSDQFDTWYPPGDHVGSVCWECDLLATAP